MNTSRYRVRPGRKSVCTAPTNDTGRSEQGRGRSSHRESAASSNCRKSGDHRWALLLIFQAMDAAARTAPSNVMSGLNPQGTQVTSFKRPSDEEQITTSCGGQRRRCPTAPHRHLQPPYYEEVLVVPHLEIPARQNAGETRDISGKSATRTSAFERLTHNGTVIRSSSTSQGGTAAPAAGAPQRTVERSSGG
jgi:polyphosphate kinase 2 (PPK2 family)